MCLNKQCINYISWIKNNYLKLIKHIERLSFVFINHKFTKKYHITTKHVKLQSTVNTKILKAFKSIGITLSNYTGSKKRFTLSHSGLQKK